MPDSSVPVFIPDLRQAIQMPEKGIVSRILQNDEQLKIVLYGLAAGYEMSLHAAAVPAILYFVEGEATLTRATRPGRFAREPSRTCPPISSTQSWPIPDY
jgi:hypothetical protein